MYGLLKNEGTKNVKCIEIDLSMKKRNWVIVGPHRPWVRFLQGPRWRSYASDYVVVFQEPRRRLRHLRHPRGLPIFTETVIMTGRTRQS